MIPEVYTRTVRTMVNDAVVLLENAAKLMREHHDEGRAMDLDEAIDYAKIAIDEE